jgi:hypothetical protein
MKIIILIILLNCCFFPSQQQQQQQKQSFEQINTDTSLINQTFIIKEIDWYYKFTNSFVNLFIPSIPKGKSIH